MKTILAALAVLGCSLAFAADDQPTAMKGTLYHVVSFKFKESADKEKITEIDNALAALKEKVPGVTSLKWGNNVSPENRAKGFTQCFVFTFATEKDRDGYIVHPAHKAFIELAGPSIDDVMVIDFWAKE